MAEDWKQGLPAGKVTPAMLEAYEVYYSPMGFVWHRKKAPEKSTEKK